MPEQQHPLFDAVDAALADFPALRGMLAQVDGDMRAFYEALNVKVCNYDLVSEALAAHPVENPHVRRFMELIDKDFTEFCDAEPAINDVIPIRTLLRIKEELLHIASFPTLYSRRIGAVGGGFSSGKSAFINSFLTTSGIRLAEGRRPVTAIPCYIISNAGEENSLVRGISCRGGIFTISGDAYRDLSHKMLKTLNFNLKEVIRDITVLTPMPDDLFGHLCIMDTPGYNPPRVDTQKDDWETAKNYISKADFLIWLVGLDANGTIPKSDLDFLSGMDFGKENGKPLFIVANKAELKPDDDIEDILDDMEESLADAGFLHEGICAYSSKDARRIFSFREKNIYDFLKEHNQATQLYDRFIVDLHHVFRPYIGNILADCDEREEKYRSVKGMLLDALESGASSMDGSNRLEDSLNDLLGYFQGAETREARLHRARDVRNRFIQCLKDFCDSLGIVREKKCFCIHCGAPMSPDAGKCPRCGKATA